MEGCYKNPEAIEAIYDFSLFLYRCAESGDLSATQIRKLLFMSQINQKRRRTRKKEKGRDVYDLSR